MSKTIPQYHDKMKHVLKKIFEMDKVYIDAIFHGDPFDKIFRNISTRNDNGEIFYNHKRMLKHFPRSTKANEIVKDSKLSDEEKLKLLYLEHDVPLKIVKDELRKKPDNQMEIIHKALDVTLITKEEAGKINSVFKSSMPVDGGTRYEATGIQVIAESNYP